MMGVRQASFMSCSVREEVVFVSVVGVRGLAFSCPADCSGIFRGIDFRISAS